MEQPQSKYVPKDSEKGYYHLQLERPYFDKRSGKKLSMPFIQLFSEKEYEKFVFKKDEKTLSNSEMLGYEVKVLWNPKGKYK